VFFKTILMKGSPHGVHEVNDCCLEEFMIPIQRMNVTEIPAFRQVNDDFMKSGVLLLGTVQEGTSLPQLQAPHLVCRRKGACRLR
jgi:hypothetical protein